MVHFRRGLAVFSLAVGLGILWLGLSPNLRAEEGGDLSAMRADVRTPPSSPSPATPPAAPSASSAGSTAGSSCRPYDPNRQAKEDAESSICGVLGLGALWVAASPVWAPMAILDDNLGNVWCYPAYPYEQTSGYLFDLDAATAYHAKFQDPAIDRKDLIPDRWDIYPKDINPRRWSLRAAAEYGDNFDRLHYTGGSLLLSSSLRLGLDTNWRYYEERLDNGRIDSLNLGKADITFQIAQSEHAMFRIGLGTNWLSDRDDTNFGFNFNYAVDILPRKPWVLSAEFDAGTLGNTHVFHGRATAGVLWQHTEVFAGFDYLDVGRVNSGSLIGGVRFWF